MVVRCLSYFNKKFKGKIVINKLFLSEKEFCCRLEYRRSDKVVLVWGRR